MISVSDPSATINYVRDNLGRATTIQNILGTFIGQQFTFHQSFNAVDQRTELRAVHGIKNDFRNTYAYDNLRRLTQIVQTGQTGSAPVVDKRVSFEYNTQGLRSKLSRFESTSSAHPVATTDYSYDTTKRLTGIAHKQGTTNLNTYSLIYDDMHRITSITSTLDGKVDFDYDQRSQLTSVVDTTAGGGYNDVSQTLAYDQRGNRTGTGYTVNSDNRLTAAPNGVGMTYDNEGNLKTMSNKRFEWDHRNRLTQVWIGNVDWVAYEYDAFNRMVKRTQFGMPNTTLFAYDEGINPLLQWESDDNRLSHRYLWSDSVDELLADEQFLEGMTTPNTKWAMSDHQGTIKDIVDYNPATGVATVDRHRKYDPFGDRRGAALPTDIVFGYTGKYFDEVTGLQNNWNRWYDPKQGRFISQDPIGFAGGDENLYRYVGNGPTNATDPTGLDEFPGIPVHMKSGIWLSPDGKSQGAKYRGNGIFRPFDPTYNNFHDGQTVRYMKDPNDLRRNLQIKYVNGPPNFGDWLWIENINGKPMPARVSIKLSNDITWTDEKRRRNDYDAADQAFREKIGNPKWKREKGYTWHHQSLEKGGMGQMVLVNTDVHSVAKHTGSYSVYRDLQIALSRKDRKAVAELLEKGKALKLLRVAKVAGGGLSVVFVAQAGFAGFEQGGVAGAVEGVGREIAYQDEIGEAIMIPNDFIYRGVLGLDPNSEWDEEWRLIQRIQGTGVNPSGLGTKKTDR